MPTGRRQLSVETIVLACIGMGFLALGAGICVFAYKSGHATEAPVVAALSPAEMSPALPPPLPQAAYDAPAPAPGPLFAPAPTTIFTPPPPVDDYAEPAPYRRALRPAPLASEAPDAPPVASGVPMPPRRPIDANAPPPKPGDAVALTSSAAPFAAKPPPLAPAFAPYSAKPGSLADYDHFTAVYDLTAHTVYLPDGTKLEAHSGLGPIKDDPAHVDERDRGATPPHVYDLTLREDLFHGVQALRLNPVGGPDSIFGRAGLLAHTYMLGPDGDSNGCVSFKNYQQFLQAFQAGQVRRLAVVTALK